MTRRTNRKSSTQKDPVLFPPDQAGALRARLLLLPFDALIQVVALLLEQLGCRNIQFADRRDFRGRNGKAGKGGWELTAWLPQAVPDASGAATRVVVQIKQCDGERLYQRTVDELRGVALRLGAGEALLVTTGPVSRSLIESSPGSCLPTVRIVDGGALCRLLIQHGIGLTRQGELNEELFSGLEHRARGNGRADCSPGKQYLLKVSLEPVVRTRRPTAPTLHP